MGEGGGYCVSASTPDALTSVPRRFLFAGEPPHAFLSQSWPKSATRFREPAQSQPGGAACQGGLFRSWGRAILPLDASRAWVAFCIGPINRRIDTLGWECRLTWCVLDNRYQTRPTLNPLLRWRHEREVPQRAKCGPGQHSVSATTNRGRKARVQYDGLAPSGFRVWFPLVVPNTIARFKFWNPTARRRGSGAPGRA